MKKRIASMILVALILVGIIPPCPSAAASDVLGPVKITGGMRDFQWPAPETRRVLCGFLEKRSYETHYALDLDGAKGEKIVASYDGKVVKAVKSCSHNYAKNKTCCGGGYGNYVVLEHDYITATGKTITLYSRYAHMTDVSVKKGDTVKKGQKIGTVGCTGRSSGNHLHYEILYGGWSSKESYSIDPYANQLLEMPDGFKYLSSNASAKAYVKAVKELYATEVGMVQNTYASHCQIETTVDVSAMSMPCSNNSDPASVELESFKKGTTLTAVGLAVNKYGNHWYEICTSDGKRAYVWAGEARFVKQLTHDLKMTGGKDITTVKEGDFCNIVGTVSTQYNTIAKLYAYIYSGDQAPDQPESGKKVVGSEAEVSAKSYTLKESKLDRAVPFGKLKPGTYTLALYARYQGKYAEDSKTCATYEGTICVWKDTFQVVEKGCSHSYSSKVTTEATCAKAGVKTFTCSKCGHSYTETIPVNDKHTYQSELTTGATCMTPGEVTHTCIVCGHSYTEQTPPEAHTFENGYCVHCQIKDPDYNHDEAPTVVISNGSGAPGGEATVTVSVKNNPGIASMKLELFYSENMILTEIIYNEQIGGVFQMPQTMGSPVILNWVNGTADSEGDWVFATLTFRIHEDAQPGEWAWVYSEYDADDIYNIAGENIYFASVDSLVIVSSHTPGDVNGDGAVNNKDVTRLFQHLSGWDVEVNEAALDINGDGAVNNKDATRLFQYLSGWDVTVH